MNKVDVRLITASAVVAAQLGGETANAQFTSPVSTVSILDGANATTGVEKIEMPDSAESTPTGLPIRKPTVTRWTKLEKNRYRKLVVKFASASLSQSENEELRELQSVRARFEDPRTATEIIDEFKARRQYAELINSLKQASLRLKR